ncbi:hypothetical protein [Kitasatospora griseola]|uniref:hypothetical protein n=1 Tax=Kitasatospora griseola TaxID=2064 RepID=UPI00364B722B
MGLLEAGGDLDESGPMKQRLGPIPSLLYSLLGRDTVAVEVFTEGREHRRDIGSVLLVGMPGPTVVQDLFRAGVWVGPVDVPAVLRPRHREVVIGVVERRADDQVAAIRQHGFDEVARLEPVCRQRRQDVGGDAETVLGKLDVLHGVLLLWWSPGGGTGRS